MLGRTMAWLFLAGFGAAPGFAGVKDGIADWARGDYPAAVAEWKPAAAAGDADAEFNLAQAYRLGRGVPEDRGQAEAWYYKAAQQGHAQAEANYGLILFQNGDRAGAMPWLQKAALLGDARAQYVVGTALFNGDLAAKDWPRAYAYMSRAAAAGLPLATSSLAQMDGTMPAGDRQQGLALARSLAGPSPSVAAASIAQAAPPHKGARDANPQPRMDVALAGAATAADASPPGRSAKNPAAKAGAPKPPRLARPAIQPSPGGRWRVQFGAYGNPAGANAAWKTIARASALAALEHFAVAAGPVTRLQAGPFATRDAAIRACLSARVGGTSCFVVAAP